MIRALTTSVVASLAMTCSAAPALADVTSNPNARSLVLSCPQGTVTGTAAAGSSLLLDGGGVAVLQGLMSADGRVLLPVNPGLERNGRLVRCTYDSPNAGPGAVAFVLFP